MVSNTGGTPRLRRAGLRNPRQRGIPSAKGGQVWTPPQSARAEAPGRAQSPDPTGMVRGGGQTESRPYEDGGKRRGSAEAAEGVLQTLEAGLAAQELHRLEEGRGGRATGNGDT